MNPLFTILTPTFNRAHTIGRVYNSLCAQSFTDFEWLVIDDGSTDGTRTLIEEWRKEADFPIRYEWQVNGHKKVAFNHGVRLCKGRWLLPADSDDEFPPEALERFVDAWEAIPVEERSGFVGVCGLCESETGKIVGNRFPGDWGVDSDSMEIRYRYKVRGEKWGFSRVDVLREFPYPEKIAGNVPESVVWSSVALRYKTRFINKVVRVYHQDSGNQVTGGGGNPAANAAGTLLWKKCVLETELDWFWFAPRHFLFEGMRWVRFWLHVSAFSTKKQCFVPNGVKSKLLIGLGLPGGVAMYLWDRYGRRTSQ